MRSLESPSKEDKIFGYGKYLNLGIQMVVTVLVLSAAGWWLDKQWETSPIFLVLLSIVGVGVALFQFIRDVQQLTQRAKSKERETANNE